MPPRSLATPSRGLNRQPEPSATRHLCAINAGLACIACALVEAGHRVNQPFFCSLNMPRTAS